MAILRPSQWPLILVHMLLLQLQPFKVQGGAHLELRTSMYQKLRRLDEKFQQFQVLTQARLDMLALNQNRNSSRDLESQVQVLTDQYHRISQDLDSLKKTTTQEMDDLREWSRKLEKKSKRMEGRLALLERNLRESSRRHTQKQRPDLGQDFSNLTLELQSQEERLVSLEAQREELLVGLKGLQESLQNQGLRMSRLEGRLGEVLQGNGGGFTRGSGRMRDPLTSNTTPQEYYEPRRRSQTPRGRRPGRILDRHTQPRPQDNSYSQSNLQAPPQNMSPPHSYQHQAQPTPNPPKPSKAHSINKPPRPQTEPWPQPNLEPQTRFQYPHRKPQSSDFQPQPEPYQPQHQQRPQPQNQPDPPQRQHNSQPQPRQSLSYLQSHMQPQGQHPSHAQTYPKINPRSQGPDNPSWPQSEHYYQPQGQAQLKPTEDRQMRTRLRTPPPQPTQPQLYPNLKPKPQASDFHPQPQSESFQPQANKWRGGEEEESDGETGKSAEIQNFLQLPVRQKIPAQPATKKDATICNVDSMLFFPSASVENYVTFSLSFPDLPELSVCLWLRVEAGHVGTLLSYATVDNDNQLVLYGRDSSASSSSSSSSLSRLSSSSFSASSSRSNPSYSSSAFSTSSSSSRSSPTLDFVIGDPVYRRLPAASLVDGRWHHLCVLWSSIQGRFWHYTDRRLTSSGSNFQKGWEVPGGGSVVLGQEQDAVGGGFDPAEGFTGRMAGLRVWDRVLSPMEVEGVAEGRGVPRGVVLGMEDIKEVHGEVKQVACECLEHCV